MLTTYCLSLSIRGAIRNGEHRGSLLGNCTVDGRTLTADEILDVLIDHLAQGHEMLPYGPPCDRWDWKEGCNGHQKEEAK